MNLNDIQSLIEAMAASDLSEMEFSENGWTLRLRRNGASPAPAPAPSPSRAAATAPMAQPAAQPPPAAAAGGDLCAPLAGVLHLQSAPGAPPFVREGDAVEAGAVLCVIEAMKVFNTVRAEQAGTIAAILVASGSEVEAGQLLMQIA